MCNNNKSNKNLENTEQNNKIKIQQKTPNTTKHNKHIKAYKKRNTQKNTYK